MAMLKQSKAGKRKFQEKKRKEAKEKERKRIEEYNRKRREKYAADRAAETPEQAEERKRKARERYRARIEKESLIEKENRLKKQRQAYRRRTSTGDEEVDRKRNASLERKRNSRLTESERRKIIKERNLDKREYERAIGRKMTRAELDQLDAEHGIMSESERKRLAGIQDAVENINSGYVADWDLDAFEALDDEEKMRQLYYKERLEYLQGKLSEDGFLSGVKRVTLNDYIKIVDTSKPKKKKKNRSKNEKPTPTHSGVIERRKDIRRH